MESQKVLDYCCLRVSYTTNAHDGQNEYNKICSGMSVAPAMAQTNQFVRSNTDGEVERLPRLLTERSSSILSVRVSIN